jgi:hypothetical protein
MGLDYSGRASAIALTAAMLQQFAKLQIQEFSSNRWHQAIYARWLISSVSDPGRIAATFVTTGTAAATDTAPASTVPAGSSVGTSSAHR